MRSRFTILLKRVTLMIAAMAFCQAALAINEQYKAPPLKGNQVQKDSSSTVSDTVYMSPSLRAIQSTFLVQNLITFKLDEAANFTVPDTFKVTLTCKVYFLRDVNGSPVSDSTGLVTLVLDYNRNDAYVRAATYTFKGGYQAQVVIKNVTANTGNLANFQRVLMVENEITVQREYQFSCTQDAITSIFNDLSSVAAKGELEVHWNKDRPADEYDLEWTYVDDSALSSYYKSGSTTQFDPVKIFRRNASRVSISKEQYFIPLLYDSSGTLFYRVRAVQTKTNGQRVESMWSSDYSGGLGQYHFIGHEPSLNWQARTSYAEEGKRKSVVQYFDGSLRSRQTVTKDNTTDTTVVAETFYDHQGRPAIQVLPSPSLSNIIRYNPNYNSINSAEYTKLAYDGLLADSCYCTQGAPAMDSLSGSSRYYSPNNPNVANDFHQFIPDAKKYPFTETRYTPDNTGRISIRGGVGKEFQIGDRSQGGAGHETKYFYGAPDQEELDALFGTEAGNASHYFKNMVRDANGQYSVSYVDMHGRTIATALAGSARYMDPIPSNNITVATRKLLDSNTNIIKGNSIESGKSFVVTRAGRHRFVYSLMPDSISINDKDNIPVCYDCKYDLEITIADECSNTSLGGAPVVIKRENVSVGYDTVCNPNVSFPGVDTTVYLTEGTYLVTKKLIVSNKAMDFYRDSIFLRRNTVKTLNQYVQDQLTTLRSNSCTVPCDDCAPDAGEERDIRMEMLADMTPPYGQYANPDSAGNDIYSAFYALPNGRPYSTVIKYTDENHVDDLNAPRLSISDFTDQFKAGWADSLLRFHPEYPRLIKYEQLKPSNAWDTRFKQVNTYKTAVDSGFLNPGNFTIAPTGTIFLYNAAHRDPLFTDLVSNGTVPAWSKTLMSDSLHGKDASRTISAWAMATIIAHCKSGDNTCAMAYRNDNTAFALDSNCSGELDAAWRVFRDLYLQEKREVVDSLIKYSFNSTPGHKDIEDVVRYNHVLHFISTPRDASPDAPSTESQARDSMSAFINNNCREYALQWWSQLKPCSFNSADSAAIINRLIQVCQQGGDSAHVFGASTVRPASTNADRSFEQVIKAYAGARYNSSCNVYLITAPSPYDKTPFYSNKPIFGKPDSCECATITSLYNQYQLNGADTSFSDYIFHVSKTRVSAGMLDTLRRSCKGQIVCNFLNDNISLPPVLQCGARDICVSCAAVDTLYKAFKIQFPGITPLVNNEDSVQQKNNLLFERYMNDWLGFNKKTDEYLDFMNNCNTGTGASDNCDSLSKIMSDFSTSYNTATCTSTKWAVNHMFSFVPIMPWCNVMKNGLIHIPETDTVKEDVAYDFRDSMCLGNTFTTEVRIKMPWDSVRNRGPEYGLALGLIFDDVSRPRTNISVVFSQPTVTPTGMMNGVNFHGTQLLSDTSALVADFRNYRVIKLLKNGLIYSIYVDDTLRLVVTDPKNSITPSLVRISVAVNGLNSYIDWVKVTDSAGVVKFYEDFNDSSRLARPDPSVRCQTTGCQTAFASYFNQRRGTNYSYSQIDSIYNRSCGIKLSPCANAYADTLQHFAGDYARSCDTSHFYTSYITPNRNDYSLSDVFTGGYAHIPDQFVNTQGWGSWYEKADTLCTGNVFTLETRIKKPARDSTSQALQVQVHFNQDWTNDKVGPVFSVPGINTISADSAQLLPNSGQIGYTRAGNYTPPSRPVLPNLADWVTVKIKHTSDKIWHVYYNDSLVSERFFDTTVRRVLGWSVGFQGKANNGYVDYVKIYDSAGSLQYYEGFEDCRQSPSNYPAAYTCGDVLNCQQRFAKYFNQRNGTGYSYAKIDSLYSANGVPLTPCDTLTQDSLLSLYNKFICKYSNLTNDNVNTSKCNSTAWRITGYFYGPFMDIYSLDVMKQRVFNGTLHANIDTTLKNVFGSMQFLSDGYYFQRGFRATNAFSFEAKVRAPAYNSAGARINNYMRLGYWNSSINQPGYIDEDYTAVISEGSSGSFKKRQVEYASSVLNNRDLGNWHIVRYDMQDSTFRIYYDSVKIFEDKRDGKSWIKSANGIYFDFGDVTKAELDWIRMYNHDTLVYFEDFTGPANYPFSRPDTSALLPPGPCTSYWPRYFNANTGKNYTYDQIKGYYKTMLGINLDPCPQSQSVTLCGRNEPVYEDLIFRPHSSCDDSTLFAVSVGTLLYQSMKDSIIGTFNDRYLAKCLSARYNETFTVTDTASEFHYTLYYYDQAGNLVKTVPPAGVDMSKFGWLNTWSDSVKTARRNRQALVPGHQLTTNYRYNTLNQVVAQASPDGGSSSFWYDRLGRLTLSQNARQRAASATENNRLYSYTQYDYLGRITEIGQVRNNNASEPVTSTLTRNPGLLNIWFQSRSNLRGQITQTVYDLPYSGFTGLADMSLVIQQRNLRNRVSYISYSDTTTGAYNNASFYTYDIHGNVDTLLQDYGLSGIVPNIMNQNNNRWKKIAYKYDLISGKVNMVLYQPFRSDRWYHRYSYDAENRLTLVETSLDSLIWEKDARYSYYRHGPLARIVLGDQQVQGIDYAYTLQGWLKGINSISADSLRDPGTDGLAGSTNQYVAKDAIGLQLNYFSGDYQPINRTFRDPFPNYSGRLATAEYRPLFNGNISSQALNLQGVRTQQDSNGELLFYNYHYDQLNRLTAMDAYIGFDKTANSWTFPTTPDSIYKERVAYDANGNILRYRRNGYKWAAYPDAYTMDSLTYNYYPGTNRLEHIRDAVPAGNFGANAFDVKDIDDQPLNNYGYDAIGNLIRDSAEGIASVQWNVYGKIAQIDRRTTTSGDISRIRFNYDAHGNRIGKDVLHYGTNMHDYTWYVRDGQGNVISTYNTSGTDTGANLSNLTLNQWENYIYGSSRLGSYSFGRNVDAGPFTMQYYDGGQFVRRWRFYELSNHLGNVVTTISDKKIGVPSVSNSSLIGYYQPDYGDIHDYYPFGMLMQGRGNLPGYRYGFNGKEMDNEVKGGGNELDYGARVYDSRAGRFLSVDPITRQYPELTPYQFASNNPVQNIDLDGLEGMAGNMASPGKWHIPGDANDDGMYSRQELKQGTAIVGATALVTVDALVTKGALTRTFGRAMMIWGGMNVFEYTNRNNNQKDPVIRAQNEHEAKGALTDLIMGWGISKMAGKALSAFKNTVELVGKRYDLANKFYKAAGFTDDALRASHIEAIDFSRPVEAVTWKKGSIVSQWVNAEKGIGNYFTTPGNKSQNLGIPDYSNRVLKRFVVTEDVEVLKSTAADYKGAKGGGTQLFSTELKNAIKEIPK